MAQTKSEKVCEFCGTEEKVGHTLNFWRKTCCYKCWEDVVLKRTPVSKWVEGDGEEFEDY